MIQKLVKTIELDANWGWVIVILLILAVLIGIGINLVMINDEYKQNKKLTRKDALNFIYLLLFSLAPIAILIIINVLTTNSLYKAYAVSSAICEGNKTSLYELYLDGNKFAKFGLSEIGSPEISIGTDRESKIKFLKENHYIGLDIEDDMYIVTYHAILLESIHKSIGQNAEVADELDSEIKFFLESFITKNEYYKNRVELFFIDTYKQRNDIKRVSDYKILPMSKSYYSDSKRDYFRIPDSLLQFLLYSNKAVTILISWSPSDWVKVKKTGKGFKSRTEKIGDLLSISYKLFINDSSLMAPNSGYKYNVLNNEEYIGLFLNVDESFSNIEGDLLDISRKYLSTKDFNIYDNFKLLLSKYYGQRALWWEKN